MWRQWVSFLTIRMILNHMPYNVNKMFSVSLNKTFPSFHLLVLRIMVELHQINSHISSAESTSRTFSILSFFHQLTQYWLIAMAGKNITLEDGDAI